MKLNATASFIHVSLAFALCSLGCGSGGKGTTTGYFPIDMTGTASSVSGCGAYGLAENDDVAITLTGNRITVRQDTFDFECRGRIFGIGDMTFAGAGTPQLSGFDFMITAKDDCFDLDNVDWTNLAVINLTFDDVAPAPVVECTDPVPGSLGYRIECTVDTTCMFTVLDPFIVYDFNLGHVLRDTIDDAIF
jgi:hypothetical protein